MQQIEIFDKDANVINTVANVYGVPIREVVSVLCGEIDHAVSLIEWYKASGLYGEIEE